MSKILYPFVTGLAVVSPCDCGLTVAEIAQKDVPAGVPYRIVEDADLPTDGSPQSAWEADFSQPDGYGIGPEAFYTQREVNK